MEEKKQEEKKEEPEKRLSDNVIIWATTLIVIMLLSIFSIRFFITEDEPLTIEEATSLCLAGELDKDVCYIYKGGYVFVKLDNLWYTRIESEGIQVGIPLHFHPGHLENISITGSYNHTLFSMSDYFYITFDPLGTELQYVALATAEFDRNMLAAFGKTPIAACSINETEACKDRPILNCTNTDEPLVYMKQNEEPSIVLQDNCIKIQGQGPGLVKATDRMLLSFYEIM